MGRVALVLLWLCAWTGSAAQDFLSARRAIYAASARQWMCRELQQDLPSSFRCDQLAPPGTFSASPRFPTLSLPASRQQQLEAALTSSGNCYPLLPLRSLSDLYFPLIHRKLDAHQLPRDYAFLPLVLTGCDPHYTDVNDRAGMWAMDYLTARREGLRVDSLIDERRGADFTTDAAVRRLASLHQQFSGDVPRVLLAWYRSPAFAQQLTSSSEAGWYEALDADSRTFLELFAYLQWRLTTLGNGGHLQDYFEIFSEQESLFFTADVRYEALHAVLGADVARLHEQNPVYIGRRIPGDYRRVPFSMDTLFTGRFDTYSDSVYRWKPPVLVLPVVTEFEEKTYHKVRRGETLGAIAAKHHVTVAQLKKWNKLRSDRIREGQKLVIHRKVRRAVQPAPIEKETPEVQPQAAPADSTRTTTPPPRKEQPAPKPAPKKDVVTYTVRPGDSLWKIAKKYPGVTPEKIMEWNKCGENIRPGQKLKIYPKR